MHLTDDQLNEYLDNETSERAKIESHLSSCDECAARLTALESLFAELDSLPELELSHSLAARFILHANSLPQLPRWLTLTATLQTAVALIALVIAAPFVISMLPAIEPPSFMDLFLQLQSQWTMWLDALSQITLPTMPEIPIVELSSLILTLILAGVSMLWLVGNGLLLRNQIK